jgi:hypothetical protein
MISSVVLGCWPARARRFKMRWIASAIFNHEPLSGVYKGMMSCAINHSTIVGVLCPARLSQINNIRNGGTSSGKASRVVKPVCQRSHSRRFVAGSSSTGASCSARMAANSCCNQPCKTLRVPLLLVPNLQAERFADTMGLFNQGFFLSIRIADGDLPILAFADGGAGGTPGAGLLPSVVGLVQHAPDREGADGWQAIFCRAQGLLQGGERPGRGASALAIGRAFTSARMRATSAVPSRRGAPLAWRGVRAASPSRLKRATSSATASSKRRPTDWAAAV